MNKKTILWIIVALILINSALAFGVRPAKKLIAFEPNTHFEYSFRVVNENHEEMDIQVYAEGDLANHIELEQNKYNLTEEDGDLTINYKLNLPEELTPGENLGKIVVVQSIPELIISGSSISARLRLTHKVIVNVPYPDKYISARIDFTELEEEINISTHINNLGIEDIGMLKTEISILDGEKEIENLETRTTQLKIKEKKTLSTMMDRTNIKNGSYKAMAKIGYDDQALELIKELIIGRPNIKLVNHDQFFMYGIINEFNIELINEWNTNISNIYAEIFIFKENQQVASIKTISFDLTPYERKTVTSYFDARDFEEGEYSVDIVLNYLDYKSQEDLKIEVLSEEEYRKKIAGTSPLVYWIIGIMAIVIIVLTLLILKVFRMKKEG